MFRLPVTLLAAYISSVASVNSVSLPKRNLLRMSRVLAEEEEADTSWLVNYSLKFESCHSHSEYGAEDGVGSIVSQNIVRFNMCSSAECGSNCRGGRYIMPLGDFVTEYANQKEADCEQLNCDCDEDDSDDCESNCYSAAGLDYCIVDDEEAEQVDIRDYVECQEFDIGENDDDNEQAVVYIGLKCSDDGRGVNLAIFTDEYCTNETDEFNAAYDATIVSDDCISCAFMDDDADDGANYAVSDMCENSYGESLKCEQNLSNDNPDNEGCEIIDNFNLKGTTDQRHLKAALAFAVIFFVATLILATISVRLCLTSKREIMLNDKDVHENFNDQNAVKSPTSRIRFPSLNCFKPPVR